MTKKKQTHFGYQTVDADEKASKVKQVFDSVANKYDLMNDLMSFGVHRLWKHYSANVSHLHKGDKVLDVASGSGDLSKLFSQRVGEKGEVFVTDINEAMLNVGRDRLTDQGIVGNVKFVIANAECLPFRDSYFNCISIGFGLRNVTDKKKALQSMYDKLLPGGKIMVLDFSKPTLPFLDQIYDAYSFSILPMLGQLVTNDKESYQYLAESIRMHPDQEALKTMIESVGFEGCTYDNLTGGIVALHTAYKF